MSWQDILKKLSPYESAVADEFADDRDMERGKPRKTTSKVKPFPKFDMKQYADELFDAQRRVYTKDSTGQDEEAAERTKREEGDKVAEILARNKKARKNLDAPVEKLVEWVHG